MVDRDGTARASIPAPRWGGYVELALMEIRRYGAASPRIVRRLNALYDRLCEVADDAERPIIEPSAASSSQRCWMLRDSEERAVAERPDRLGLGGAP